MFFCAPLNFCNSKNRDVRYIKNNNNKKIKQLSKKFYRQKYFKYQKIIKIK